MDNDGIPGPREVDDLSGVPMGVIVEEVKRVRADAMRGKEDEWCGYQPIQPTKVKARLKSDSTEVRSDEAQHHVDGFYRQLRPPRMYDENVE